ncbi:MAG: hypothetical protein EP343_00025 [Deltaproteobacteria bacterium]|nr:MAG: hypothetical protein EP343_00025 [Deltaproteobacteria bacterium]
MISRDLSFRQSWLWVSPFGFLFLLTLACSSGPPSPCAEPCPSGQICAVIQQERYCLQKCSSVKDCKAGEACSFLDRVTPMFCLPCASNTEEVCNGKDDDCNGFIDDGLTKVNGETIHNNCPAGQFCDEGKCQPNETPKCEPGTQRPCYTGPLGTKDVGLCKAGEQTCLPQAKWGECKWEHTPQTETCDGQDNNCDGSIDEPFRQGDNALNAACSKSQGACKQTGTYVCKEDGTGTVCDASPGSPQKEVCNGLDDDCDGTVDNEDPALCGTHETCAGQKGCLKVGTQENPGTSCKAIMAAKASKGDGIYWIKANAKTLRVYCDMTTKANGTVGGWTLCLNTRYDGSVRSRALYTSTYSKVYDPTNDPYGYYEFCDLPTTKGEFEYRLVVAKQQKATTPRADDTYKALVDSYLSEVLGTETLPDKPDVENVAYSVVIRGKGTWLIDPSDSIPGGAKPDPYTSINLWYYFLDGATKDLYIARGSASKVSFGGQVTNDPRYTHRIVAGCGGGGCPQQVTPQTTTHSCTNAATYRFQAAYNNSLGNQCLKTIQGDRVQVYVR